MNRRDFLSRSVAFAASALVPTWAWSRPQPINLKPFCYHENGGEMCHKIIAGRAVNYHIGKPFVQEIGEAAALIATDGRTCVRVDVDPRERDSEAMLRPPVANLPWTPGLDWMPWPEKRHMLANRTICPRCEGEGFVVRDGMAYNCELCDSDGHGVFPGIQAMKAGNLTMFVEALYDQRIRDYLPEPEWSPVYNPVNQSMCVAIRFKGGYGMQSKLDDDTARERMKR